MNLAQLANYPFLKESLAYLKENGPSLDELLHDIAYERTRAQGKQRVLEALDKGEIKDLGFISEADSTAELLSYVVARILVSCVNDTYLIKRYALAEARSANLRLQNEDFDFVVMMANEFDLDVNQDNGMCKIHFTQYLKNTSQMRAKEWKIVNQNIKNGYIILEKNRLARVIQQALQRRIEGELPAPVNNEILKDLDNQIKVIRKAVDERKNTFKARDFGKVRVTKLPPCIRHLLAKVQANENLSHSGRFALTTFFHALGMSADEIIRLFAASPDFDESKTRYQIEHITGKISGTEYTPPECSTMKSYSICFGEDRLCKRDWMTHPLKYYRVKDKSSQKKEPKDNGTEKTNGKQD
jgi:DNA primase large subunit